MKLFLELVPTCYYFILSILLWGLYSIVGSEVMQSTKWPCDHVHVHMYIVLQKIGEALKENKTLKELNIESNYVSGDGIIAILEGISEHQVMEEFRVANQVSWYMIQVHWFVVLARLQFI